MKEYEVQLIAEYGNVLETFSAEECVENKDGGLWFYVDGKITAAIERNHWVYVRVKK